MGRRPNVTVAARALPCLINVLLFAFMDSGVGYPMPEEEDQL